MAQANVDVAVKVKGLGDLDRLNTAIKETEKAVQGATNDIAKFSKSGQKIRTAANGLEYFTDKAGRARKVTGQFVTTAERAAAGIDRVGNASQRATGKVDGLNRSIRNLVTGAALLAGAKFVFGKTAELERTTKQLATVTGSLQTAKGILNELQVINKKSPFSFIELADTSKRLSAFGIANKDLVETTERLGKAAAATGARVNDLALAYGQVAAKGKLQTEELYQFQERGIPLLDELAKGYGKTKAEVAKLIEKGLVGFPAVEQAIKNITTGNGKFAKAFENTADTLDAKLSNAIDSLGRAAAAFGELLKPRVIELLKGAESVLTDITALLKSIPQPAADAALKFGELAAKVFLVSKAIKALIATSFVQWFLPIVGAVKAGNFVFAAFILKTKVLTAATILLRAAMMALPWVALAAGIGFVISKIIEMKGNTADSTKELEKAEKAQRRFDNIIKSSSIPAITDQIKATKAKIKELIAEGKEIVELTDKMSDLVARRKEISKLQRETRAVKATDGMMREISATKSTLAEAENSLENRKSLADAYYNAELKILGLKKQRAQQQKDIVGVYQIEVKQAQLVYQQTLAQIMAEVQKAQLKVRQVQLATQELKVQLLLKKAKEGITLEDKLAYKEQLAAVQIAQQNLDAVKQIAIEQTKGAQAVFVASAEAARYGYNQAYVAQQAERTATAQQRSANALAQQAKATSSIASGGAGAGDTWKANGKTYTFQGSKSSSIVGSGIRITNRRNSLASTAPQGYAEGGYVSGPTNALLGEAGESEYVIPSSKMDSAMSRYAKGARGESVTEGGGQKNSRAGGGSVVNVNTGPVMRMNNKDYVTITDLNSALGSVMSAMGGSGGNYGGSARVG